MELYDVMRTTFACREFTGEPVPDEVLHRVIDNARFAPSGGNRQGWRVIHVTRDQDKQELARLSLPAATRYVLEMEAGHSPFNTVTDSPVSADDLAAADPPNWFVSYIGQAPTLLVVAVDLALVAAMDKDLPRVGIVGGGSIYPLIWNILLAARNEGYAGTMTTMGVNCEPQVQALLNIPETWAVASIVPLGVPVKQLSKLRRKPVEEVLVRDRWDGPGGLL